MAISARKRSSRRIVSFVTEGKRSEPQEELHSGSPDSTDSPAFCLESVRGSPSFRPRCLHACTGSQTARDRPRARHDARARVTFRVKLRVGVP